ncbi:IS110 family transposase [Candidatus Poriferisodalis sp.]|uniref:IS110 family transposase n=1 Tax=Candidatus Poriferisodalis sp. TaxID=3101277 RepID=UPI003B02BD90
MTVVGIDTHTDTLAACAADDVGRAVAHRSFENTPQGHAELAGWVHELEAALVAMEGSGNYGRPAAVALAGAGVAVVEVPPNMTAAARRRQRTGTKTDPADALAIARVGLAEPALRPRGPAGTSRNCAVWSAIAANSQLSAPARSTASTPTCPSCDPATTTAPGS